MKSKITLFVLALSGIAYLLLNPLRQQINPSASDSGLFLWLWTLKGFAIPLILFGLSFTGGWFAKIANLVWSATVVILSIWILWNTSELTLSITGYGFAFVGFILVIALTLFMASLAELASQINDLKDKQNVASPKKSTEKSRSEEETNATL